MLNTPSLNKHQIATTVGGFHPGPTQALYDDVKEEPTSPADGENQTCIADADNKDNSISKRRTAHTVAEQKRRDAIKKGYDDLQIIVPACSVDDSAVSPKMSKAVILQKSIDYLRDILEYKQEKEKQLRSLKDEAVGLKIMKTNYEDIAKSTQAQASATSGTAIPDEVKFNVFKTIMDAQFHSFNDATYITNFEALSASVFKWLEEESKPEKLHDIVLGALGSTNLQNA